MSFDIESARVRVGLDASDTSKDAQLVGAMNASLAIAENYCDRKFMFKAAERAKFYYQVSKRYTLKRYPIEAVLKVQDSDGNFPEYKIHHLLGRLELKNYNRAEELEVDYAAGYKILPADIELALWGIFDATYKAIDNPGASSGSSSSLSSGAISSINIPDVGTVSFNTSGSATTATAARTAAWGQYGSFFHLLDYYRDISC